MKIGVIRNKRDKNKIILSTIDSKVNTEGNEGHKSYYETEIL